MNTTTRNSEGFINSLEYKTDKHGFIIWRDMISPEYLYPNKEYFERRGQAVPSTAEGLADNQCLVKIGGLIELMRIRGYTLLDQQVLNVDNGYVTAKCTITWLPNLETDNKPVTFSWVANSNVGNCGDFMANFQETQAQNRALSLCIRKFLNINIVSDEEMSKGETKLIPEKEKSQPTLPDINNKLKNMLIAKGLKTQESLLAILEEMKSAEKISIDLDDVKDEDGVVRVSLFQPKECRIIMGYLKNK
jgi:hypothetical protein